MQALKSPQINHKPDPGPEEPKKPGFSGAPCFRTPPLSPPNPGTLARGIASACTDTTAMIHFLVTPAPHMVVGRYNSCSHGMEEVQASWRALPPTTEWDNPGRKRGSVCKTFLLLQDTECFCIMKKVRIQVTWERLEIHAPSTNIARAAKITRSCWLCSQQVGH